MKSLILFVPGKYVEGLLYSYASIECLHIGQVVFYLISSSVTGINTFFISLYLTIHWCPLLLSETSPLIFEYHFCFIFLRSNLILAQRLHISTEVFHYLSSVLSDIVWWYLILGHDYALPHLIQFSCHATFWLLFTLWYFTSFLML